MAASGNLFTRIVISAEDQASKVFGAVLNKWTALSAALGTAIGAVGLTDAIGKAADFEVALDQIQSKTGASADEMARFEAAALKAGSETKYTATEAANALTILGAAGLNATDSIATLPSVLALAASEGIGLEQAAGLITDTVTVMGLSFAESARATDVMVAAANLSSVSATQMGESLKYAGASAKDAGLSIEQTAAVLDVLASSGLRGEQAGTSLRNILAQLGDPAGAARKELAALGITTGDLNTVVDGLKAAGPQAGAAVRAFGVESGPALQALIAGGSTAIAGYTTQLQNAGGAAQTAANVMSDNLTGAFSSLSSAWDTVGIVLTKPLLEPIKAQVVALTAKFQELASNGSLTAFSTLLVNGFNTAAAAVGEFMSSVDWSTFGARLQTFAQESGATLASWGQKIQAVGSVVEASVSAMSAVWSGFKGAVEVVGAAVAQALALIMIGYAKLAETGATLGLVQDATAAKARLAADAMSQAADDYRAASVASFQAVGAALSDLSGSHEQATVAAVATVAAEGKHVEALTEAESKLRDLIAAETASTAATTTGAEATIAAEQSKQAAINDTLGKIRVLEAAYRALLAMGDGTAAVGLLQQIEDLKAGLTGTGTAATQASAKTVEAFAALGVTTQATLQQLAANAKANFDTIRTSGTASAVDIEAAYQQYSDAAEKAGVKVEQLAGSIGDLVQKREQEQTAAERNTTTLGAENALRVDHLKNLASEASARGDTAEATRLNTEASAAEVAGLQAALTAKQAEVVAAQNAAAAKLQEADADGIRTQAELAAIATTNEGVAAKQREVAAIQETIRNKQAEADANKQQVVNSVGLTDWQADEGAKQVKAAQVMAMEGAASMSAYLAKILDSTISSIGEFSAAALKEVSGIFGSLDTWYSKLERLGKLDVASLVNVGQFAEAENAIAALGAAAEEAHRKSQDLITYTMTHEDWIGTDLFWQGIAAIEEFKAGVIDAQAAAARLELDTQKMGAAMDDLAGAFDTGDLSLTDYITKLERLQGQYGQLGDERLAGLRAALADARQQMDDFAASATEGLQSLQQEWADLNGQQIDVMLLEQQRERVNVETELAQAKRDGNTEAITALQSQLALLDQIHTKQLNDLASEEAAQAIADADASARDTARFASLSAAEQDHETALNALQDQLAAAILAKNDALKQAILDQIAAENSRHDLAMASLAAETTAADQTAGATRDVATAAGDAAANVKTLGEQDLSTLRAGLADAKAKSDALASSAQAGLSSLQVQWASLNGNQQEVENLEYQAARAKLEEQLTEARAAGSRAAVSALNDQLALLDQIHRKKLADIADEARASPTSLTTGTDATVAVDPAAALAQAEQRAAQVAAESATATAALEAARATATAAQLAADAKTREAARIQTQLDAALAARDVQAGARLTAELKAAESAVAAEQARATRAQNALTLLDAQANDAEARLALAQQRLDAAKVAALAASTPSTTDPLPVPAPVAAETVRTVRIELTGPSGQTTSIDVLPGQESALEQFLQSLETAATVAA